MRESSEYTDIATLLADDGNEQCSTGVCNFPSN